MGKEEDILKNDTKALKDRKERLIAILADSPADLIKNEAEKVCREATQIRDEEFRIQTISLFDDFLPNQVYWKDYEWELPRDYIKSRLDNKAVFVGFCSDNEEQAEFIDKHWACVDTLIKILKGEYKRRYALYEKQEKKKIAESEKKSDEEALKESEEKKNG